MKIGRIICAAGMVLLCAFGWFTQVRTFTAAKNRWQASVEEAQEYEARGLHQKAVQSYETALSVREDGGIREKLLEAYRLAYQEGAVSRSAYKSALENACGIYPKREDFWVRLVSFLRDSNSYPDAYKALGRAGRAGAGGEALAALNREITYAFTEGGQYFTGFFQSPEGHTAICSGDRWGVVGPDGEREIECDYAYISPYSGDGSAVFCTEEEARLLDAKGVLQAVLTGEIPEARAYGGGMLPVRLGEQWVYRSCEDGTDSGGYEDASSYQNGRAAVCRDGVWSLVDLDGNRAAETDFSAVRLYGNGDYSYDGLFSAAVDGSWRLCREDGEAVSGEFSAKDLDLYLGGAVAFQDASGLWGFVDKKGNVVLEPQYPQARSFSGGLAAVFDGDRWGFINEAGELAIDCQFLDAGYFSAEGACPVSTVDGEFHMIVLRFPVEG